MEEAARERPDPVCAVRVVKHRARQRADAEHRRCGPARDHLSEAVQADQAIVVHQEVACAVGHEAEGPALGQIEYQAECRGTGIEHHESHVGREPCPSREVFTDGLGTARSQGKPSSRPRRRIELDQLEPPASGPRQPDRTRATGAEQDGIGVFTGPSHHMGNELGAIHLDPHEGGVVDEPDPPCGVRAPAGAHPEASHRSVNRVGAEESRLGAHPEPVPAVGRAKECRPG